MPDIDAIAAQVRQLQDAATLAPTITAGDTSFGSDAAYAVSSRLRALRLEQGWTPVGRKIGFTNRTIYEEYGVYQPIFGTMYDRTVACLDMSKPLHEVPLAGLSQPRLEPEIVFKLKAPPPRSGDPVDLLGAVEWMAHGIELVQCHFPDWKFQVADTIADGGLHGLYRVGNPVPVPKGIDERRTLAERLERFTCTLLREDELMSTGGGEVVLGSPLNALAHLVEVLASLPDHPALEAGELVTTGTLTAAMPVQAGETWSTR
ncbi:MAG: 2-keto-4-pentenoate hydratase, partial [Dehalococcoidia bacterium]